MIFPTCFIAHSWYSLSDDVVFILNFQAFFIISQAYVNTYFVNLPYEVVTENKKKYSTFDLWSRLVIVWSTYTLFSLHAKFSLWLHFLCTISLFSLPFNKSSIIKCRCLYWLTPLTGSLSMVIQYGIQIYYSKTHWHIFSFLYN